MGTTSLVRWASKYRYVSTPPRSPLRCPGGCTDLRAAARHGQSRSVLARWAWFKATCWSMARKYQKGALRPMAVVDT